MTNPNLNGYLSTVVERRSRGGGTVTWIVHADEPDEAHPYSPKTPWFKTRGYWEEMYAWHDELMGVKARNAAREELRKKRTLSGTTQTTQSTPQPVASSNTRTASVSTAIARSSTTHSIPGVVSSGRNVCIHCNISFNDYQLFREHLNKNGSADRERGWYPQWSLFTQRHYDQSHKEDAIRVREREYERRPYLADRQYVERYAGENREALIARCAEILKADEQLMHDERFVEFLKRSRPLTGESILATARFEMRALALAETNVQKRETEAEWRARQERLLTRRIEDAKSRKAQELKLRGELDRFLTEQGVTDAAERERQLEGMIRKLLPESRVEEQRDELEQTSVDEAVDILGR